MPHPSMTYMGFSNIDISFPNPSVIHLQPPLPTYLRTCPSLASPNLPSTLPYSLSPARPYHLLLHPSSSLVVVAGFIPSKLSHNLHKKSSFMAAFFLAYSPRNNGSGHFIAHFQLFVLVFIKHC
jgi:hypothetical protein